MEPSALEVICRENREKFMLFTDDGVYYNLKLKLEHCRMCQNYAYFNGAHYCRTKGVNE